jgi:hypothetical protein
VNALHLITGEYPPACGGVGDYSAVLARGLAAAGCHVHVWAPAADRTEAEPAGVTRHHLPRRFGPRALRLLDAALREASPGRTILVQYAPNAFGFRGVNLLFCGWLLRRRLRGDDVRVMFHEPFFYFAWERPWRNALALAHRLMAMALLAASRVVYLSSESWRPLLAPYAPAGAPPMVRAPIPSTVPVVTDPPAVAVARRALGGGREGPIVGHFGTYGTHIAPRLEMALAHVLAEVPAATVVCLGRNARTFAATLRQKHPAFAPRVAAVHAESPAALSVHLQACDLLIQPYPEGVTTRRTSMMAGLAHAVAIVTTHGRYTEPLWREADAPSAAPADDVPAFLRICALLATDVGRRRAAAAAGRRFYGRHASVARALRPFLPPVPDAPVVLGVHAQSAAEASAEPMVRGLGSLRRLSGVERCNLQFADHDAGEDVPGFEACRVLTTDSRTVSGIEARRKPVVAEIFAWLAARALHGGSRYFAYLNAEAGLRQDVVDLARHDGRTAYVLARTSTDDCGAPGELQLAGIDGLIIDARWWLVNAWRFRPYILGEPIWDSVYASLCLCHGNGVLVYRPGELIHEGHPVAWRDGPCQDYLRLLAALDAPYLSLWCRFHAAAVESIGRVGGERDLQALARATFVWQPSRRLRLLQSARAFKARLRHALQSSGHPPLARRRERPA